MTLQRLVVTLINMDILIVEVESTETIEKDKNQYKDEEIFWSSGACMFLSKKIFNELGGFETFFAHMEEIDFCWRAFNHGYKTHLVSSSKIYHLGAATIKKDSNRKHFLTIETHY